MDIIDDVALNLTIDFSPISDAGAWRIYLAE